MTKTAYKILEEIFTNQITVLNIAVPTEPLDLESAKDICLKNNYDVHLIKDPEHEDLQVYIKKINTIHSNQLVF